MDQYNAAEAVHYFRTEGMTAEWGQQSSARSQRCSALSSQICKANRICNLSDPAP